MSVRWLTIAARIASWPSIVVADGAAMPDSCRSATISALTRVGVRAAIAEADDVQRHRRQQFQLRLGGDPGFQVPRQRAGARDHRAQLVGAVGLEREPGLQRPEAARQIRAVVAGPGRAGGEPAGLAPQIGRRRGESARDAARRRAPAGSRRRTAPGPICGNRSAIESARSMPGSRGAISRRQHAERADRRRRRGTTAFRRGTARPAPRDRRSRRCRPCRPCRSPGTA